MKWAKDARNTIEKEGDLDLYSSLALTLIFSYFAEEDVGIECSHSDILQAGVKRLIRHARKNLPAGVEDAALVKIERRWVTASLPTWELLRAITYAYSRTYDCCNALAGHLGELLDSDIPAPGSFEALREEVRQVHYLKLRNLHTHSFVSESFPANQSFEPPVEIRAAFEQLQLSSENPKTAVQILEALSKMAQLTFNHWGNHVPMLFLYNAEWLPIEMLSPHFSDQADKFLFWRHVAERVEGLGASGLAWISESWLRRAASDASTPVRKLQIIGEQLHAIVLDKSGLILQKGWTIVRSAQNEPPTLVSVVQKTEMEDTVPYYLYPARRAMGLIDLSPT